MTDQPRLGGPIIADMEQPDIYYAYATGVVQNLGSDGSFATNGVVVQAKNHDNEMIHVVFYGNDIATLINVAIRNGILAVDVLQLLEEGDENGE